MDASYIDDDDLLDTLQVVNAFPRRKMKTTQPRKRGCVFSDEDDEETERASESHSEGDGEVLYIDSNEESKNVVAGCKRVKQTARKVNLNNGSAIKGKGKGVGKSSLKK